MSVSETCQGGCVAALLVVLSAKTIVKKTIVVALIEDIDDRHRLGVKRKRLGSVSRVWWWRGDRPGAGRCWAGPLPASPSPWPGGDKPFLENNCFFVT